MGEIKKVSIKHNEIMDFMIANPTLRNSEVAAHFNVTPAWLSCIVHSDIFQASLKEKQEVAFHHTVLPLREKMTVAAHLALDKMIEQLPAETDIDATRKVADSVLDRLGYGTKQGNGALTVNAENVHVTMLRSELEEARALIGTRPKPQLGVIIDGVALPVSLGSETPVGAGDSGIAAPVQGVRTEGEVIEAGGAA